MPDVSERKPGDAAVEYALRDRAVGACARLRVVVIIATTNRSRTCRRTIARLSRQSRRPDRVLVVAVTPSDVEGIDTEDLPIDIVLTRRGLTTQRNHALDVVGDTADLLVFLDDDFVPADRYLEEAERLFLRSRHVVGATGLVIADGAHGPGIDMDTAESLLAAAVEDPSRTKPMRALYGCNMVVRAAAVGALRFDEMLPLYGWQEDVDFSWRLGAAGPLIHSAALVGVHLGQKDGRTSGTRLGYSQIANPIYLLRKGSMPRDLARRVMRNNLLSNLWRSLAPEPWIDRRGRLLGNVVAVRDWLTGRLDPRRIIDLR